ASACFGRVATETALEQFAEMGAIPEAATVSDLGDGDGRGSFFKQVLRQGQPLLPDELSGRKAFRLEDAVQRCSGTADGPGDDVGAKGGVAQVKVDVPARGDEQAGHRLGEKGRGSV